MKKKELSPIQKSKKNWEDKMYKINFRIDKSKKDKLLEYCAKNGLTVNGFLNKLVDEALDKDK